jgi:hypothetical protein
LSELGDVPGAASAAPTAMNVTIAMPVCKSTPLRNIWNSIVRTDYLSLHITTPRPIAFRRSRSKNLRGQPDAWSQISEEYITMSEEFDPKMHSENSPFKI